MGKVNAETAMREIRKWLEFKKIDDDKIEEQKDNIEALAKSISAGHLILDDSFNLIYTLKWAILDDDGGVVCDKLTFKPRLKIGELQAKTQNIKATDAFALISAYVSALTNQNSGIIKQMDSEDYKTAQAITVFFL